MVCRYINQKYDTKLGQSKT
uniref:Uncharacterized protein n=1 Tax=Arundo donax TaxID=35708 RepID=A0A0A9BL49_ARUDO